MRYLDVPKPTEVAETLASMGGQCVTATALCSELSKSRPRRDAQLGIQRAMDKQVIRFDRDWTLSNTRQEP